MTIEEFYGRAGGDLTDTAARLGGRECVERFLMMLAGDDTFDMLQAAMEAGDVQRAFRAAHTLKGVASNMGLEHLRVSASALTEALRGGDMEMGRQLYLAVERDCRCVREGLETLESGVSM